MSVHNTCSRASLIMRALSQSASLWLLLDCSPHEMTVDSFPAITKSIFFCSRYVCIIFAKKEVNCCFVLVWDKIYFKLASLVPKTSGNTRVPPQASNEQADAQSRPQVSRRDTGCPGHAYPMPRLSVHQLLRDSRWKLPIGIALLQWRQEQISTLAD